MDTKKDLRYPIGHFIAPEEISKALRSRWIQDIEKLPAQMQEVCTDLSPKDLELQYRADGWTIRELVHHVGDSHLNAFLRFKWALTEDQPLIKAYDEKAFAQLAEYKETPVEVSLQFIKAMHLRWQYLLQSMDENDFQKTFQHPLSGPNRLDVTLGHYSWHGRHHLAHIYQALA